MSLSSYPPPVLPTIDDNLIFSDVIEFNLKNNPTQPFYIFSDSERGLQVITHLEFGRATHRIAHEIRPPSTGRDGEVVAIIAHTDCMLYQTITAGLIVAGFIPFPVMIIHPPAVVADLLIKTSCRRVLATTTALKSLIDAVKTCFAKLSYEVEFSEIPSIDVAYPRLGHEDASYSFKPYPLPRRPSVTDTCIIATTSGSTGIAKHVKRTHLFWSQVLRSRPESRQHSPRMLLGCMALNSPSGTYAITLQLFHPLYRMIAISMYPPPSPATGGLPLPTTPQTIIEHAKATGTTALFALPTFMEAWLNSPEILEYLRGLEFVGYTGTQILPWAGNQLAAARVKINMIYAGTEFGSSAPFLPREILDQWEYVRFSEHISVRWNPQGNDIFECQLLACKTHKPMIINLPDIEGYATGDLFKPHPTKKGLWKNVGRLNDVLHHSSGKKTVPVPIENIIAGDPRVSGVVVFGADYPHTGVLIELRPEAQINVNDKDAVSRLLDDIWPTIEEANKDSPDYSKILKEFVIFAAKEKPLPRHLLKSGVLRLQSVALYGSEISQLYISNLIEPKESIYCARAQEIPKR